MQGSEHWRADSRIPRFRAWFRLLPTRKSQIRIRFVSPGFPWGGD